MPSNGAHRMVSLETEAAFLALTPTGPWLRGGGKFPSISQKGGSWSSIFRVHLWAAPEAPVWAAHQVSPWLGYENGFPFIFQSKRTSVPERPIRSHPWESPSFQLASNCEGFAAYLRLDSEIGYMSEFLFLQWESLKYAFTCLRFFLLNDFSLKK